MTPKTLNIAVRYAHGGSTLTPVPARFVELAGLPDIRCFVHRDLTPPGWTCTEYETGLALGRGKRRIDAEDDAITRIWMHGMERLLNSMSAHIMQYGRANP